MSNEPSSPSPARAPRVVTVRLTPDVPRITGTSIAVYGTAGFDARGDLIVLEERWAEHEMRVHAVQRGAAGWSTSPPSVLSRITGSPIGRAISPDGAWLLIGAKTARLYDRARCRAIARARAVRFELGRHTVAFSPGSARFAVADGGYVNPRQRRVTVYDVPTATPVWSAETREWSFSQIELYDDETLVCMGLALDWTFGVAATAQQTVLGVYTAHGGWRRTLEARQLPRADALARRIWIRSDPPSAREPATLLALDPRDGSVCEELRFEGGWSVSGARPAVLDATRIALWVYQGSQRAARLLCVDHAAGAVIAQLDPPVASAEVGSLVAHGPTNTLAAPVSVSPHLRVWTLP